MYTWNMFFGIENRSIYDDIYKFITTIYKNEYKYEAINTLKDGTNIDLYSYHAFLENSEHKIVAYCRISPIYNGEWECSQHVDVLPEIINEKFVQVNRVVVEKNKRGLGLYKMLLNKTINWFHNHSEYSYYFSICEKKLSMIYKRSIMCKEFDKEFIIPKRNNKTYVYLYGEIKSNI